MVRIFKAHLIAVIDQIQDVLVSALRAVDDVVVDGQIVAGAVGNENGTVPVEQVAASGGNMGQEGVGVIGGDDGLCFRNLNPVESADENADDNENGNELGGGE
jgi:hypothetical protein